MENNHQNIPEEIFSWLQARPFEALDSKEKERVTTFFSAEDYDEMHQTAKRIKNSSYPAGNRKEEILDQLLNRFDQIHPPSSKEAKVIPIIDSLVIWKVASVALLICSGWLGVLLMQSNEGKAPAPSLVALRDTIYQIREVATEPIHLLDTVYLPIYLEKKGNGKSEVPDYEDRKKSEMISFSNQQVFVGWQSQGVLPFEAINSEANEPKKNSMKDDSLNRQFTFVTL